VDDVYNIYVVDNQGVFKGAVSLKDLVLADPQTRISQIMDDEAISIKLETDQEEVANIFHKYDLVAAPVVDQQGRLVGRITVDDVLDVVQEEASEDITMMAGITDESIRIPSIFKVSGVRLPWLLVAFVGELVSAGVMMHFEASVAQVFVAAIFIPLIMAMGGNMGIQSSTVVIRGLATGDIHLRDTGQRLRREISVAFLNGFVIVFLLIGVVTLWSHLPILGKVLSTPAFGEVLGIPIFGMILGFALLAVLFNAAFMGTLLPFLFKRLGFDPAIATGPFITTTNDVLGLLVYFGIITGSLGWF
jgi:magnesium transporter